MDEQFFDIDEIMVDYAEMTSFDFNSNNFLMVSDERSSIEEYLHQPFTFKYGNYDLLDLFKSMFMKTSLQNG